MKTSIGVKQFFKENRSVVYGKSAENYDIDMSLSVNPLGCSKKVLSVLKKTTNQEVSLYPQAQKLKEKIAIKLKIKAENITLGSGSENLILTIPKLIVDSEDEIILPNTSFPVFEQAAQLTGAKTLFAPMTSSLGISLQNFLNLVNRKTGLIILCNPNNPTGQILSKNDLIKFINSVEPITVILDEAMIEFGGVSLVSETDKLQNLIILRTFSKAFGLAGLRIGFSVSNEKTAKVINEVNQPFPVSNFAIRGAIAALDDLEFINKTVTFTNTEREFLAKKLAKLGLEVLPSQTNNLLVKVTPVFSSSDECVKLLEKESVGVVNGSCFRGLGQDFIRICPKTRKINQLFLNKLSIVMKK